MILNKLPTLAEYLIEGQISLTEGVIKFPNGMAIVVGSVQVNYSGNNKYMETTVSFPIQFLTVPIPLGLSKHSAINFGASGGSVPSCVPTTHNSLIRTHATGTDLWATGNYQNINYAFMGKYK